MSSKRWTNGVSGYNGLFGDSFFGDCWDVVDTTGSRRRRIVHEDVTSVVPEEKVKPWFRKTNLSKISDDDIYQVMLEVSNFKPSDLSVKLVDDKTVTVEGKHGERADADGFVSREFTRRYNLPESVIPSSVECYLSADGVLVIRGHAPRSRPNTPNATAAISTTQKSSRYHDYNDHSEIPIFTRGYQKTPNNGNHNERVIPITQGNDKEVNGKDNVTTSRIEGERASPAPKESSERSTSGRNRIVSFTDDDDDTIASDSPIVEEPSISTSSPKGPSPSPGPSSASAPPKRPSTLHRQNNFAEESFTEKLRSNSRMSEERSERSQTPIGHRNGKLIDTINMDFDHSDRFDDFDKLHKDIIERHRHLSRESMERMQLDTDKFFSNSRSRSPLILRSTDDQFGGVFEKLDKWSPILPVKSRENQYEKKSAKGYDKNGAWTETFEERLYSQQFSSSNSKSNDNRLKSGPLSQNQRPRPLEHSINVTSAA